MIKNKLFFFIITILVFSSAVDASILGNYTLNNNDTLRFISFVKQVAFPNLSGVSLVVFIPSIFILLFIFYLLSSQSVKNFILMILFMMMLLLTVFMALQK